MSYLDQDELAGRVDELEVQFNSLEGGKCGEAEEKEVIRGPDSPHFNADGTSSLRHVNAVSLRYNADSRHFHAQALRLAVIEDKIAKLHEVLEKTTCSADTALSLVSNIKRTLDAERKSKEGSLEEEVDSLRFKMQEVFSGHHTLSQSVQRMQRSLSEVVDTNAAQSTAETLSQVQGKLALLWKNKADKDEVDRAITRAVEAVMHSIPQPPGQHDGSFITKSSMQCLSCERKVSKVGLDDEIHSGKLEHTQPVRSPELLFGGGLLRHTSNRKANYSGLDIPPQTERMFPYSGMQRGTTRDLVGDAASRHGGHTSRSLSTPRNARLGAAARGPGGFKPPPVGAGRRHELDLASLEHKASTMQPTGFRPAKKVMPGQEGESGYGSIPLLPTPPINRPARPSSKEGMSAWTDKGTAFT